MTTTAVRLELPADVVKLGFRLQCASKVLDREVLVSCVANVPGHDSIDIPSWPVYRLNGLPSKFIRAHEPGEIQTLPNLVLPKEEGRTLDISLSSSKSRDWAGWRAVLTADIETKVSRIWILEFGAAK